MYWTAPLERFSTRCRYFTGYPLRNRMPPVKSLLLQCRCRTLSLHRTMPGESEGSHSNGHSRRGQCNGSFDPLWYANWGMEACRIRRTAENLLSKIQTRAEQRWGIAPSSFDGARNEGHTSTHDTAQIRAHWAGNPVATSALADSGAAPACDAHVQRRLNSPDDPPPSC
jgi:hypothetical protein